MKLDMQGLENILRPWRAYEAFVCKDLDATQNPNFRLTALGDDLTVQLLSNLEPLGDYS